jgi:L-alanine-DL-glutamate epimerase-like enolase superfamily enzyme
MDLLVGELKLQYKYPFGLSRWTTTGTRNLVVCVRHEGITGWGEGSPNRRYGDSIDHAAQFVRSTAGYVEGFLNDPQAALRAIATLPGSGAGHAALDMALHDWLSRAENESLYAYLGFASPGQRTTSFTIGIDKPEVMEVKTQEAADYRILKVKVGTEQDVDSIEAVRRYSSMPIRVDANEGWSARELALERIKWLSGKGVELVEQPMPAGNLSDVAWLRDRSPLPILADEDCATYGDLESLADVYDGVNIKLDKCGGLYEAARMVKRAKTLGLQVLLGCMVCSSLATTAAFHLASAATFIDLDGHLLVKQDPFLGLKIDHGDLILPAQTGIGAIPVQDMDLHPV